MKQEMKEFGLHSRNKSDWVDLTRVKVNLDPMSEWKQMYSEAWRLQKENYWVDFTLVAMAAMPAFGIEPEAFLAAIKRNQKCAGKTALEASPIYTTLLEYLKMKLPNGGSLTRTPTGLKEDLDAQLGGRRRPVNWPKNAAILSGELKHLQALLASEGIAIDFIHSGDRKIGITFTPPLKKKFLKRRRALPSSPSDSPEPAQRVSQA